MNDHAMARYDLITSLVFLVIGVYMMIEGLMLPGAGGFIEKGGEPGRVVVMLGAIVSVCAIVLFVRSIVLGGHRTAEVSEAAGETSERNGFFRAALTIAGCSLYAVGLLGSTIAGWPVQYHQATALFIFCFIVLSEWSSATELGANRWAWLLRRAPGIAGTMKKRFGFIGADKAPYVWLTATALLQAVLVTWAVTYLFEQEFYVKLP